MYSMYLYKHGCPKVLRTKGSKVWQFYFTLEATSLVTLKKPTLHVLTML